jgi:hypothetical protein
MAVDLAGDMSEMKDIRFIFFLNKYFGGSKREKGWCYSPRSGSPPRTEALIIG